MDPNTRSLLEQNTWVFDRGVIDRGQLKGVEKELTRIANSDDLIVAILHHHLIGVPRPSYNIGTHNIPEIDLLANGPEVLEWMLEHRVDIVLHGHRHVWADYCYGKYVDIKSETSAKQQRRIIVLGGTSTSVSKLGMQDGELQGFQTIQIDDETAKLTIIRYEMKGRRFSRSDTPPLTYNLGHKIIPAKTFAGTDAHGLGASSQIEVNMDHQTATGKEYCTFSQNCNIRPDNPQADPTWKDGLIQTHLNYQASSLRTEGHPSGFEDYGDLHVKASEKADLRLLWVGTPIIPTKWVELHSRQDNNPISEWLDRMRTVAAEMSFGPVPIRFCFWQSALGNDQKEREAAYTLSNIHREFGLGLIFVDPGLVKEEERKFQRRGFQNFKLYRDFAAFASEGFDAVVVYSLQSNFPNEVETRDKSSQFKIRVGGATEGRLLFRFLRSICTQILAKSTVSPPSSPDEIKAALSRERLASVLAWPKGRNVAKDLSLMVQWIAAHSW
ncbi:MAG: metallophosphoesterase family protein [Candidatus Kryptoniota bacterium]